MDLKGIKLGRQLRKRAKDLKKLLDKPARRIRGDSLHGLRVATRRLRAILWLAYGDPSQGKATRLHRHLKALGRSLGKVRLLEVAQGDARVLKLRLPGLKKDLARRRAKLEKRLKKKAVRALGEEGLSQARRLKRKPPKDGLVLGRVDRLFQTLAQAKPQTKAQLHKARVSAKRLRYALEALDAPAGSLALLQDKFGRLHDMETLIKMSGAPVPALEEREAKLMREAKAALPLQLRAARAAWERALKARRAQTKARKAA